MDGYALITLENKIMHLKTSPGDIVTVSGLTSMEFRRLSQGLEMVGWGEHNKGTLLIQLPKDGALDKMSWEQLQEWQEERSKDDR